MPAKTISAERTRIMAVSLQDALLVTMIAMRKSLATTVATTELPASPQTPRRKVISSIPTATPRRVLLRLRFQRRRPGNLSHPRKKDRLLLSPLLLRSMTMMIGEILPRRLQLPPRLPSIKHQSPRLPLTPALETLLVCVIY